MKIIKTLLVTSAFVVSCAVSTVNANGFFKVDDGQTHQQQPDTFNEAAHKDTAFWGFYNKDLAKETPKIDPVSSFDSSKHEGTYFWGVYHN